MPESLFKGVTIGGRMAKEAMTTHTNFRTKKGPTVSVSNISDIAFYGCYTDQKFHEFYHVYYNFSKIHGCFSFFLTTEGE